MGSSLAFGGGLLSDELEVLNLCVASWVGCAAGFAHEVRDALSGAAARRRSALAIVDICAEREKRRLKIITWPSRSHLPSTKLRDVGASAQ